MVNQRTLILYSYWSSAPNLFLKTCTAVWEPTPAGASEGPWVYSSQGKKKIFLVNRAEERIKVIHRGHLLSVGSEKAPPPKHQENESSAERKQLFRRILLNTDPGILLGGWLVLIFCYCFLIYYMYCSLFPCVSKWMKEISCDKQYGGSVHERGEPLKYEVNHSIWCSAVGFN